MKRLLLILCAMLIVCGCGKKTSDGTDTETNPDLVPPLTDTADSTTDETEDVPTFEDPRITLTENCGAFSFRSVSILSAKETRKMLTVPYGESFLICLLYNTTAPTELRLFSCETGETISASVPLGTSEVPQNVLYYPGGCTLFTAVENGDGMADLPGWDVTIQNGIPMVMTTTVPDNTLLRGPLCTSPSGELQAQYRVQPASALGGVFLLYSDGSMEMLLENTDSGSGAAREYRPIAFLDESHLAYEIISGTVKVGYGIYDVQNGTKSESTVGTVVLGAADGYLYGYEPDMNGYDIASYWKIDAAGKRTLLSEREGNHPEEMNVLFNETADIRFAGGYWFVSPYSGEQAAQTWFVMRDTLTECLAILQTDRNGFLDIRVNENEVLFLYER